MAKRYTGLITDYQGSYYDDTLDGRINKPGDPADFEEGVLYIAPYESPYGGFPEHARRCAKALDLSGLPVRLQSVDPRAQLSSRVKDTGDARWKAYEPVKELLDRTIKRPIVELYQLVPHDEQLYSILRKGSLYATQEQMRAINRRRILYTVWERDRCSLSAASCLSQVGQCWVANHQDAAMLVRCKVPKDRIRVVPIPFMDDDPHLMLEGRTRLPGPVRFYHIGKWEPRKNQHVMIGAFLYAFRPGEARLMLKTSASAPDYERYPRLPEISIHSWLERGWVKDRGWDLRTVNANIKLTKQHIPERQLLEMHRMGDVYLSLSRGEGFDMPAFDAKLSGNLMVYTPSGGPQDFAGEDDILVEPSGSIRCHSFYSWGDAHYLDYSAKVAAKAMIEARSKIRGGIRSRGMDIEPFRASAVGARMRQYIEELVSELEPDGSGTSS